MKLPNYNFITYQFFKISPYFLIKVSKCYVKHCFYVDFRVRESLLNVSLIP
jgi:hypothetical protein